MHVTLTFELPEEEMQLERCLHAHRLIQAMRDFGAWMRTEAKHADVPADVTEVRGKFYDLLEEHEATHLLEG